jgi:putative transposase
MKTLKLKLYRHKRNRHLKRMINAAGVIWNHCIALHKRYYRMWGKHLNCAKLQKHIAKLRRQNPSCGSENDRDENAAINIKQVGASTCGLGDLRRALPAVAA